LVFVIGVLSLVDHAKAVGLLHEGPLVGFTEQPVGKEQSEVNIGGNGGTCNWEELIVKTSGKENERNEDWKKLNNETMKSCTKK